MDNCHPCFMEEPCSISSNEANHNENKSKNKKPSEYIDFIDDWYTDILIYIDFQI